MIEHHMDAPSRTLVVAFSSQPKAVEWGGFLNRLKVRYILVSDDKDEYYQNGIGGLGGHKDVIDWLNRIDSHFHKVIYLGLSAGSYAALYYNLYTKPHKVIAISPVTGAGPLPDFSPHWYERLNGRPHLLVTDLKPLYEAIKEDRSIISRVNTIVSDGEGTELDIEMSTRIGVMPTLTRGYSHSSLARELATNGYLESLIK